MPESKRRKSGQTTKPKKKAPPKKHPPKKQESAFRSLVKSISDHPIVLLAGLFVLFFSIWEAVVPLFASPLIEVSGSDPASPFAFPFLITNRSWAFKMTNVTWTCHLPEMTVPGVNFKNISIENNIGDIPAGSSENYSCRVMNPNVPIMSLTMDVRVTYTTFYGLHRSYDAPFTWIVDGEQSKWIAGSSN